MLPHEVESAIWPALDQLDQTGNLLLVFGQNGGRFSLAFEPFVYLPDAFDRPTKVRVRFGDADHLVNVAGGAFANLVGRLDKAEIVVRERRDINGFDRAFGQGGLPLRIEGKKRRALQIRA